MPLILPPALGTLAVRPAPIPLLRVDEVPHPERAIARGDLIRVRQGVYAPRGLWQSAAPWDRYLARVYATAMMHPGAVFWGESAAALLGGPVFGDPGVVHVLGGTTSTARAAAGIRTHVSTDDRSVVEMGGIAVVAPVEFAVDLARSRHPAIGLAVANAVRRMDRSITAEALMALNESRTSSRGRRIARWSLQRATPTPESVLESVSLAAIEWLGLPLPELQVSFVDADGDEIRPDFVWARESLAGEADGDLKFDGRYGDARTLLRKQIERDTALRQHVRSVAHWGWAEATNVAPLRDLLRGLGLSPIQPENAAALHSLRRSVAPRAPHRTT